MTPDLPPPREYRPSTARRARGDRRKQRRAGWFVLAGLLLCGMVGGLVAVRLERPVEAFDTRAEVVKVAQNLVSTVIRPDLRTQFSGPAETKISLEGGFQFHVSGWVDVFDDSGTKSRRRYSCQVYRNQVGEWVGDQLSVQPQ